MGAFLGAGSEVDLEYYQPHAPEVGVPPTLRIINVLQASHTPF